MSQIMHISKKKKKEIGVKQGLREDSVCVCFVGF